MSIKANRHGLVLRLLLKFFANVGPAQPPSFAHVLSKLGKTKRPERKDCKIVLGGVWDSN